MPQLGRDAALEWIRRWDLQQEESLPDREERFTALIDAVEAGTGRPDPLVIDLGCGPGSLSVRLLDRIPAARVVAVDADPVMLAPARAGPVAEREAWRDHADHHGWATRLLGTHIDALRAAGFAEAGTLWQRGENRLLCAVRG